MDNSAFDETTERVTHLTRRGEMETSFDQSDDFPPPPPHTVLRDHIPLNESESNGYCEARTSSQINRSSTGSCLSYDQYEELPANLYKLDEKQRRLDTSSGTLTDDRLLRRKNSSPILPAPHPPSINNSTLSRKLPSPAVSTFHPPSPENTLNGGHGRANPLYEYNDSKDTYADPYMYPTQSELNGTISNYNKCDSDGDSKKSDCGMSVPTGISLIALFVSIAALVLALLLTLGALQLNNQIQLNDMSTPRTSAISSLPNSNLTEVKINKLGLLMESLQEKTNNQSEVISQLLSQLSGLQEENNQLKIQLNETLENTSTSSNLLSSALYHLINQSERLDNELGQSLLSLNHSIMQSGKYMQQELSSLNQSVMFAIENITARQGEPGRQGATGGIDPSLCQHEIALKTYSGGAKTIQTVMIQDNEDYMIISASCSYDKYTSALLNSNDIDEYTTGYRCKCFGGADEESTLGWTRKCQLDYWQCPRNN